MTDADRERIRSAARVAAQRSRRAQGLPEQIIDARLVEQIAALVRTSAEDRRAA